MISGMDGIWKFLAEKFGFQPGHSVLHSAFMLHHLAKEHIPQLYFIQCFLILDTYYIWYWEILAYITLNIKWSNFDIKTYI